MAQITKEQCQCMIGSLLGGLVQHADPIDLRQAMRNLASNEEYWKMLFRMTNRLPVAAAAVLQVTDEEH